ncbi:MAG: enoyl-CoA hydratase/isomerase family protein, partial [Gammaproteobacteria bacterium]|nr:enoyl-CoA hydratase/isomerase family protein [Gammaproteobacteria bacterium]
MSESALLQDAKDGILVITFNRPEKYNAITFAMLKALSQAVDRFRDDDALGVLLLRATGRYYSAGLDLGEGLAP